MYIRLYCQSIISCFLQDGRTLSNDGNIVERVFHGWFSLMVGFVGDGSDVQCYVSTASVCAAYLRIACLSDMADRCGKSVLT